MHRILSERIFDIKRHATSSRVASHHECLPTPESVPHRGGAVELLAEVIDPSKPGMAGLARSAAIKPFITCR
jgi:hypothetical protein